MLFLQKMKISKNFNKNHVVQVFCKMKLLYVFPFYRKNIKNEIENKHSVQKIDGGTLLIEEIHN